MNPLINSMVNHALELKLRQMIRLDPFWQEKLAELDGVRVKLVLTDLGFKRVFQFGPTDLHLVPPFTGADVTLTTRSVHLPKLRSADQLAQAFADGHIYLIGNPNTFEQVLQVLRAWQLDWEGALAQVLPDPVAHHLVNAFDMAQAGAQQASTAFANSYRFWRDNEAH